MKSLHRNSGAILSTWASGGLISFLNESFRVCVGHLVLKDEGRFERLRRRLEY